MKNQLSAMKFVRNNKRQVGVILVALLLTLMTMYIIHFLLMTTQESFKVLFLEQPKHMACINLSLESMGIDSKDYSSEEEMEIRKKQAREDIISRLKSHEGIDDAIYTQVLAANYQGIIGSVGYYFPLLEAEQIPAYLEHMNAKLVEGRLPKMEGEILIERKVFMNQKMRLDDYYKENNYGKVFKVVGIIESDYLTCVGTPNGYMNNGWYIVVYCNEENAEMTKVLKDVDIEVTKYDTIDDITDWEENYKEMVTDVMEIAVIALLLIVMIILAISILVAYISFMRSRVNEYCLYASIGFSRREIYGMMMREIAIIFGFSILVGILLTMVFLFVFAKGILDPLGLVYHYFNVDQILRIFTAFMAIVGILQIPILITLQNIKTVDRMEE